MLLWPFTVVVGGRVMRAINLFVSSCCQAPSAELGRSCCAGRYAGTGILKLVGMDPACASGSSAIQECTAKLQLSVSPMCMIQLQPDMPVAADGTFCSPSQGVQQRGEVSELPYLSEEMDARSAASAGPGLLLGSSGYNRAPPP